MGMNGNDYGIVFNMNNCWKKIH